MTTRIATYVLAGLVGIAAMGALPVAAEDGPAKPAAATTGEKLSQALVRLSTADGFEIRGLERVGDESVQPSKSGSIVQTLRRILAGYAYTVELAPADPAGKAQPKLVRVSILGRSSDVAGDAAQPVASVASAGSADAGSAVQAASPGNGATPSHPVTHMLQTLAQSSMPVVRAAATDASGQPIVTAGPPAAISSGSAPAATGGSSVSGASPPASTAPVMEPINNPADMAALTHTATANLSALVQSMKSACPAGAKC